MIACQYARSTLLAKISFSVMFRISTRKSQLAIAQTEIVTKQIRLGNPDLEVEIVPISTVGDRILEVALSKIGEKNLFTKELETALLNDEVDCVVHSLKDLSTTLPVGLVVGAILERESPYDAVVLHPRYRTQSNILSLKDLPNNAVIGTSSVRRIAQLKAMYPHLQFRDIRGNLNTRFQKLDAPDSLYDGLILAVAGLKRCNAEFAKRIDIILNGSENAPPVYYAVGQGALAVECRENDTKTLSLLKPLNHDVTEIQVEAERSFMKYLEGGCSVPIGVISAYVESDNTNEPLLTLQGSVHSLDGKQAFYAKRQSYLVNNTSAKKLGLDVAHDLIQQGASSVLADIRAPVTLNHP